MGSRSSTFGTAESPLGLTTDEWTTWLGTGLRSTGGNAMGISSGASEKGSFWKLTNYAFAPEQRCVITIGSVLTSFDEPGPAVRCSGTSGYALRITTGGTAIEVYRIDSGSHTQLGSTIVTGVVATDTVELGAKGSILTIKRNDTTLDTRTDTTYSSGQCGVYYQWENTNASLIASVDMYDTVYGLAVSRIRKMYPMPPQQRYGGGL
jgi:hypothetical protein